MSDKSEETCIQNHKDFRQERGCRDSIVYYHSFPWGRKLNSELSSNTRKALGQLAAQRDPEQELESTN